MFVKPRKASTVMLLQKSVAASGSGFEVLMLLRHKDNPFVPGNYVFPGGALDEKDSDPDWLSLCTGIDYEQSLNENSHFSSEEEALPYWVAAIREVFEETGILFAERGSGESLFKVPLNNELMESYRNRVYDGDVSFLKMIKDEGLLLSTAKLFYHSRWITPRIFPIRYDAHFFAATLPSGINVMPDGYELVSHEWISPDEAERKYRKGEMKMVLPTLESLRAVKKLKLTENSTTLHF